MLQKTDTPQDNTELKLRRGIGALLLRPRLVIALVLAAIAVTVIANWLVHRSNHVTTADARIAADMIAISAEVSGTVTASHVSVGDRVSKGDLLYELDDREPRLQLESQIALRDGLLIQIEQTRTRMGLVDSKSGTQVDASQAGEMSARAAVSAAESDLATKQREFDRIATLLERGRVTQDVWDNSNNALETAKQNLRAAEAAVAAAVANSRQAVLSVKDTSLIAQDLQILEAAVRQANAEIERQEVVLEKHRIHSPIDGVVDELFFDIGERSLQGFRVALMHNPDQVWVSANIKETEIRKVRPGARVEIHVDSAPNDTVTGRVAVVRDLTVAEMALMPNPNASGVFTKITQRIPIRIELDDTSVALRPGSMVRVTIDRTRDAE
ncbi:MAG: HlyD family secretion protein [Alphaproteobacteria bacterium]|nr:HlyD family secretion protein [Alphaproteobacteria bacterium]